MHDGNISILIIVIVIGIIKMVNPYLGCISLQVYILNYLPYLATTLAADAFLD